MINSSTPTILLNTEPNLSFSLNSSKLSLSTILKTMPHSVLPYTIHDHSSHSGIYHPRNISVNEPTEKASRWSSKTNDQPQFVMLKLDAPAVACEILFGKFHKSDVCNLKEFKVYGGLDPNDLRELLHRGLKNDTKPETFPLRYTYNDLIFPIQYIKIVPIATFSPNFNYSIWYVEIKGTQDQDIMTKVFEAYNKYKETEAIRLCLKHFRQMNLMDVYQLLLQKTNIKLEDPLISQLYQSIVVQGDFEAAETVIRTANEKHIFDSFVKDSDYSAHWKKIAFSGHSPCGRGGHQMCIDEENQKIYLFGGWDGKKELSDFWCFQIKTNRWKLISQDTSQQGGPTVRSCHAMCFDPIKKSIYVLGRYVEDKSIDPCDSDFYQYFIDLDLWIKISANTKLEGGPSLLCDHQMCVDPIHRKLYVFGGRIMSPSPSPPNLHVFDIDQSSWHTLPLPSPTLYLSAGRLLPYPIPTDHHGGPDYIYTHRATLDPITAELYIFTGLFRPSVVVKSFVWIYRAKRWQQLELVGPCPRYTHQFVFDPKTRLHFLFGGNPGDLKDPTRRLDDLWELRLFKPTCAQVVTKCLYAIRTRRLQEMRRDTPKALDYLREYVTPLVDDEDKDQLDQFKRLCAQLCIVDDTVEDVHLERTKVFEELLKYFPSSMKEPEGTLIDAVKIT